MLRDDKRVPTHDFPEPCRSICPGSRQFPLPPVASPDPVSTEQAREIVKKLAIRFGNNPFIMRGATVFDTKAEFISIIESILTASQQEQGEAASANKVETALTELQEIFPESHFTEISHSYGSFKEGNLKWQWTVVVSEKASYGATLDEAMTKVRQWKAEQEQGEK